MTARNDERAMGELGGSHEPSSSELAGANVAVIPTVELGTVLAGKYRIDRMLGRGGMGIVVRAMHLQLEQPVAIKFLLSELQNASVVQRFMREAQAAVRLRSEHVARVLDVGALETGMPYIVLEYLEGTDLKRFPWAQLGVGGLIDLMLQACEALTEAHALGIVHRDIKPANLFITSSLGGAPFLKLLDFGVSKAWPTSDLTASHTTLGTPAYMSPEQMRSSRSADHRSDIWSLGVVLYELLQGAKPFENDTLPALILQVVNEPPPKLTAAMPAGLDAVIYRCLEKDPARRFQSIAELAVALAPYAQSPAQVAITLQRTRVTGSLPLEMAPANERGSRAAAVAKPSTGAAGSAPRIAAPPTISSSDSAASSATPTSDPAFSAPLRILVVLGSLIGIGVVILVLVRGEPSDAKPTPSARPAAEAVAPDVAAPAATLEPLRAAPAPGDGLDRAAASAPPRVDAGMADASGAPPSSEAAVLSPPRPKPYDKNRRRETTERAHATPTKRSTQLNTDRGD